MGGSSQDLALANTVDANGNQYITGVFIGTADFNPGLGVTNLTADPTNGDCFIAKVNANGDLIWVKQIGGTGQDYGRGITLDKAGNVYVTGAFTGTVDFDPGPGTDIVAGQGGLDVMVIKLTNDGQFTWAKQFMGPYETDRGNAITVDAAGNVYTTGAYHAPFDFDPGPGVYDPGGGYYDVFVTKLDANGNLVWAKNMGGAFWDEGYGIEIDKSGNVITTGYFKGWADFDPGPGVAWLIYNTSDADVFISKLDASGNLVFAKQFTSSNYSTTYAYDVALDATDNIYIVGGWHADTDFDPGPGYYVIRAQGFSDGYVTKLNSSGDFQWTKVIGGCQNEDYVNSIALDPSGNIYTTGVFMFEADFDKGPGTCYLHAAGGTDVFIQKLNSAGNFVWAKNIGSTSLDYGFSIAVDAYQNIYTVGSFKENFDYDPGLPFTYFSSYGSDDIFIDKFSSGLSAPLAVKLSNIKAYEQGNGIRVDWSNMTESNVLNYSVDRAGDIQNFGSLTKVNATKNDGNRSDYSFFDATPLDGNNYYRVQTTESDGKKQFSVILKVSLNNGQTSITVYPSILINKQLSFQATGLPKGKYSVRIFNNLGQVIHKEDLNMNFRSISGMIQLPSSTKPGTYHLQFSNNNDLKLSRTFVVQ